MGDSGYSPYTYIAEKQVVEIEIVASMEKNVRDLQNLLLDG